jgi:hypothetical protein
MMPIPWLTERQRSLLCWLAIQTVAGQLGCTAEAASDALDDMADRGEIVLRGDDRNVWMLAAGHPIVHSTRGWLAGHIDPSAN